MKHGMRLYPGSGHGDRAALRFHGEDTPIPERRRGNGEITRDRRPVALPVAAHATQWFVWFRF